MHAHIDRRTFLKSAGVAAAATMAAGRPLPAFAATAVGKPQKFFAGFAPNSLGVNIDTFWMNMEECSKVGFYHIEVDNSQLKLAQAYINRTSEFKDRMDKLNLRLVGLNEAYSLLDPAKYGDIREENALIGRFMKAIGGVYTGPYGALSNDEDLMRQIGRLCDQEGKRLWEDHGIKFSYHTHSSRGFRRLMDLTDPRYVHLNPDLGWLARGFSTREEDEKPSNALEVCRAYLSRICTIHMKDYDPNYEFDYQGRHLKGGVVLPGKGIVNFPEVVDFLKEAEFTGYWLGEHVGIGTYEYVRTPESMTTYPVFKEYMTKTLGLSLSRTLPA
jgi:sugar phosphate isomerase/epimerase